MANKQQPVIAIEDIGAFAEIMNNSYVGKTVIDADGNETWHPNPQRKKLDKKQVDALWKKAKGEEA